MAVLLLREKILAVKRGGRKAGLHCIYIGLSEARYFS